MKTQIQQLIQQALESLIDLKNLSLDLEQLPETDQIKVERCRDKSHGDFAANIAMVIAKQAKTNPRALAPLIVEAINSLDNSSNIIKKMDIAGPGFINFSLKSEQQLNIIKSIFEEKELFGQNSVGLDKKEQKTKVQIEFVSANPTGPLHVGHGRGAAYGASLANLLKLSNFNVDCEYYVNDAGRQMDILATSVWLRFLQYKNINIPFPSNAYKGDYILEIIKALSDSASIQVNQAKEVLNNLPLDEDPNNPDSGGDKDVYIDAMIVRAKTLLGEEGYEFFFNLAKDSILADIKQDLEEFGVNFDCWYSERRLMQSSTTSSVSSNQVEQCIAQLSENKTTYTKGNTLWFKSTDFGDDKDRVIQRENGQTTYFASDIAYHQDKFKRGYDSVINIWGSDHHGYITRVKASLQALNLSPDALQILLVQFANLYRQGEKVQMSTRSGSFVTLRELREEVGNDAARFFYVMRKCEQHLDFDLDIAKSKTSENPVYYVQYAHARICSVTRQLEEKQIKWDSETALKHLDVLTEEHEVALLSELSKYPEMIQSAAQKREPHLIAHYSRELANKMHSYYNKHHFIVDDAPIRYARIALILAVKQVLSNALHLLGVSAPEAM